MRSTFNLDDDMLILAQQTAQRERITLGQAVSKWMRRGAQAHGHSTAPAVQETPALRSPFSLLPAREGDVISSEHIYRLQDEEGM